MNPRMDVSKEAYEKIAGQTAVVARRIAEKVFKAAREKCHEAIMPVV